MAQTSLCLTCGDSVTSDGTTCPFCSGTLIWERAPVPAALTRSVRDAVDAWGSSVFATPKQLSRLVLSVDIQDEAIERLATHVVRRTLREERSPGSHGQHTALRVIP